MDQSVVGVRVGVPPTPASSLPVCTIQQLLRLMALVVNLGIDDFEGRAWPKLIAEIWRDDDGETPLRLRLSCGEIDGDHYQVLSWIRQGREMGANGNPLRWNFPDEDRTSPLAGAIHFDDSKDRAH